MSSKLTHGQNIRLTLHSTLSRLLPSGSTRRRLVNRSCVPGGNSVDREVAPVSFSTWRAGRVRAATRLPLTPPPPARPNCPVRPSLAPPVAGPLGLAVRPGAFTHVRPECAVRSPDGL